VTFWTSSQGGCLNAYVASLVGCHPGDVPHDDERPLDLGRLNEWLAPRELVPVYPVGFWGESYPAGYWIALIARRPGMCHAVLARRGDVVFDPADGRPGNLWPSDLACAYDRDLPLGFQVA
jgi:hypothetical protein